MAITNEQKRIVREAIWDAIGGMDTSSMAESLGGEIPEVIWPYLRNREAAIGRLLGID